MKNYIKSKFRKILSLRDLTNLKSNNSTTLTSELTETINFLRAFPNATVEVLVNDDNVLEGIYFQNNIMKKTFAAYPHVLLCDATYKLNNLRMPLYILLVTNGNNEGKIVATFILASETKDCIRHMVKIFKNNNDSCNKIETIFTDKDFKERDVFSEEFLNANLYLCRFHLEQV